MTTTDAMINPEKIRVDSDFLLGCFREVLEETGEAELAQSLENPDVEIQPLRTAQAYSMVFQLLNMVEENAAAQYRRSLETEHGLKYLSGLWGKNFDKLQNEGITPEQIAASLAKIRIEPVLTAHPTEAKRTTVLEHHRNLYLLLVQAEYGDYWTPSEKHSIREEIKTALERLWRTGEIFLEKPNVKDELRNIMHYLRHVFPIVLPILDFRLQEAWKQAGFDPQLIDDVDKLPRISFGDWVGGDRDGHPFVTAEVTEFTLKTLRSNAVDLIRQHLTDLVVKLSLSTTRQDTPPELIDYVRENAKALGKKGFKAFERNPDEYWRQLINLMLVKLPSIKNEANETGYKFASQLEADLKFMAKTLHQVGASRIVKQDVNPLIRLVKTFGFHLAVLDIRQNSSFHDKAVTQLLESAGFEHTNFAEWSEAERLKFLNEELKYQRPFVRADLPVGTEADAVLSCYRVVAEHIKQYGQEGLGSFIISMTRSVSDLLVVYLLCREVGLTFLTDEGAVCRIPVVPLLETVDDLQASPQIMRGFLEHPITQRSLEFQRKLQGETHAVQQIMIGYSDSNKDGGILSGLWNLNRAQNILADIGKEKNIKFRFFHGRGGTVSRGAGPTHRFINGLPHGSINGDFRLTEQGETISQKYANRLTCAYNLELLLAGVTAKTLIHENSEKTGHILDPILDKLATESQQTYANLLRTDGFMQFFAQATPIDVIESSRIGSRPARRTGRRSLEDLRAIPWVFSWSQSRFYISGWYGVGTALENLQKYHPENFELVKKHAVEYAPFRYILTNISTSILNADTEIMEAYANLMTDKTIQNRLYGMVLDELHRARKMVELIYGHRLETRRPKTVGLLQLRQAKLRTLHFYQIELIRKWRTLKDNGNQEEADKMLPELLLSVNAIAGGLRTTG